MLSLIAFVLLNSNSEIVLRNAGASLRQAGFKLLYDTSGPKDGSIRLAFRRPADKMTIFVQGNKMSSKSDLDSYQHGLTHSSGASDNLEKSPSNTSLGDFSFMFGDDRIIKAAADGFVIDVMLSTGASEHLAKDIRTVELVARESLAELIGATLRDDLKPAAQQDPSFERSHSSYVSVDSISKLNHLKPEVNDLGDRLSFSFNGHKYGFALASLDMVVDGAKNTLQSFVARKNGVWLLPGKDLKAFGFALK